MISFEHVDFWPRFCIPPHGILITHIAIPEGLVVVDLGGADGGDHDGFGVATQRVFEKPCEH